jgi:hypothetical protein
VALKTLTQGFARIARVLLKKKEGKSIVGQLDEDGYRIEV